MISTFALAGALTAAQGAPQDPLDVPASPSSLAARSPLFSIARADKRLIAVGQRGHILVSDDGRHWQQASVPVSTDLTAVHFPVTAQGWAVGHDGVILHSADGGRTWVKQLDGRTAAKLIVSYYERHAQKDAPAVASIVADANRMLAEGPDLPFLNVWFEDEKSGYAIGAFNLILKTSDGGKSWVPISELVDNPNRYHLYGISASGGDCYIAGELSALEAGSHQRTFRCIAVALQGQLFRRADQARTDGHFRLARQCLPLGRWRQVLAPNRDRDSVRHQRGSGAAGRDDGIGKPRRECSDRNK